jgi:hypothetical protein
MQFLVYLTVLMVSVSTVLLEIHWLTTPAPQPKPAVQASAPPPRPQVEGPSAALSPIYPKRVEPAAPPVQNNVASATGGTTSAKAEAAAPRADDPPKTAAKVETAQKPVAETTGAATRVDDAGKTKSAETPNTSEEAAGSSNRCDVRACAGAYKSFRASDCTYQPFDGTRRVCGKPPEQRADREQRNEPQRRSWSRSEDPEDSRAEDRRTRWRVYNEDDDDEGDVILYRRSRRW